MAEEKISVILPNANSNRLINGILKGTGWSYFRAVVPGVRCGVLTSANGETKDVLKSHYFVVIRKKSGKVKLEIAEGYEEVELISKANG